EGLPPSSMRQGCLHPVITTTFILCRSSHTLARYNSIDVGMAVIDRVLPGPQARAGRIIECPQTRHPLPRGFFRARRQTPCVPRCKPSGTQQGDPGLLSLLLFSGSQSGGSLPIDESADWEENCLHGNKVVPPLLHPPCLDLLYRLLRG